MPELARARVFISGKSQHVTIPAEYRFSADEVFVRRDSDTGDLILSQSPGGWQEFFAAVQADSFPEDFLADRSQGIAETREKL